MAKRERRYDTIVVGGGVSGCAAAKELAVDRDVLVIDKGQIAGEASGLAAGLIAPTLFFSDLPSVARHANEYFREFDGTGQFEFVERQRIELITPDRETEARERVSELTSEGFPVSFLEPDVASDRYPKFDLERFVGIVEYGDTGWLDPYTYTIALKERAEELGADVRTGVTVDEILTEDGSATGVETSEGTFRAPNVVVATGWRTKDVLSEYVTLPVLPFKLQCLTLDPGYEVDEEFPIGRVADEELYFRPEHNGTVLFGGGEYIAETPETAAQGGDTDASFERHVAFTVPEFLEGFERAEVVNGWSGIDAATPDARPILDAPDEVPDGIVISTGYNGIGMVYSPVAAAAIRSLVTGEPAPFDLEPFALDRYDEIREEFELFGTFEATDA